MISENERNRIREGKSAIASTITIRSEHFITTLGKLTLEASANLCVGDVRIPPGYQPPLDERRISGIRQIWNYLSSKHRSNQNA